MTTPPAEDKSVHPSPLCRPSGHGHVARRNKNALPSKLLLGLLLASPLASADRDLAFSAMSLYKDYSGSVEKRSGLEHDLGLSRTFDRFSLGLGYQYATADRFESPDLRVTKPSLTLGYAFGENINGSATYLRINDNLAPTDDGRIYSAALHVRGLPGRLSTHLGVHFSDYDFFDASQLDLALGTSMSIQDMKLSIKAGVKYISLDRERNTKYIQNAESTYLAPEFGLRLGKNGYFGMLGIVGSRVFEVADEGLKVSHHATELRRSYLLALGKQTKSLDLQLMLGHHLATELPPAHDLHINTLAVRMNYRF